MTTGGVPGAGPSLGPWAICDRCGTKIRHAALKREWTHLLVCTRCWDPRPPHLDPPVIIAGEGGPIQDPRPVPEPYFLTDNEVTWESL